MSTPTRHFVVTLERMVRNRYRVPIADDATDAEIAQGCDDLTKVSVLTIVTQAEPLLDDEADQLKVVDVSVSQEDNQ